MSKLFAIMRGFEEYDSQVNTQSCISLLCQWSRYRWLRDIV